MGRVPARLRLPQGDEQVILSSCGLSGRSAGCGWVGGTTEQRLARPGIFSTTTDTGQALARKRFGEKNVFYFPMDFGFAIRLYLRALRPKMVVIAETEFWPNFIRLAHANGARIAVVNARISDRSWPRYRRFRGLLKRVLGDVDLFLTQTDEDATGCENIGASAERVRVIGNLKFESCACGSGRCRERAEVDCGKRQRAVLVCGSTVEGEETILLKAFENVLVQHPRAVMILAPRHPERFGAVAALLEKMSIRTGVGRSGMASL